MATLPVRPNFAAGIDGLLPVVAQSADDHRVLMLAWMDEAAFDETLASGMATYYSRSRRKRWRKGEESGFVQRVIEVRVDCDADAILLLVEQTGPACHEGFADCFFRRLHADGTCEELGERLAPPRSHTPPPTPS